MSHFHVNTNHANVIDRIADAYTAAGLTPPNKASSLVETFGDRPGVETVAAELVAAAAAGVKDPAKWLPKALDQLREAHAADLFRRHVLAYLPGGEAALAAEASTEAAEVLAEHVASVAERLVDAAQHLPDRGDPFDLDHAVANHTTRQREDAQAALAELAVLAGVNITLHPDSTLQPTTCQLLAVVSIPPCEVEVTSTRTSLLPRAVNEEELGGTRAVRSLVRLAHRDGVDAALVAVARGRWSSRGLSLAVPTPDELADRISQVRRALSSEPEARSQRRAVEIVSPGAGVLG